MGISDIRGYSCSQAASAESEIPVFVFCGCSVGLIQRMWDRGEYEKSLFVMNRLCLVGILGLEPRMTGPESVVLPLHHIPMFKIKMLLF